MAVTYSQNGVIVKQDATWLANDNKNYVDYELSYPWFYTPIFNLADAQIIEENIVCKASAWPSGVSFHMCGGQWYSGTSSKFNGVAVYIWADKIEFDHKDNTEDYVTGISYSFSNWIKKNIVYDKDAGIATCRIYYDDNLVCTHTVSISDMYLMNGYSYSVGGLRYSVSGTTRNFKGSIDLNKSYIRIDGKLVWGVDNLKKDEAVIGGKTYKTVQMPDGKIWLAENLDFKFCNIGGSGTPTTPNAWYYDNDESTYGWNGYKCGLLYNWYASKFLNDNRSELCPGWHVPTKDEWDALVTACGGASTAGTKLKALDGSAGTNWPIGWNGTDDYVFGTLPAGRYNGSFSVVGSYARFWSITEYDNIRAYCRNLDTSASIGLDYYDNVNGYSIRLVRDAT